MLHDLRLRDFRCYEALRCDLGGQGAIFVGENAQGKTSILEAVCVLLRLGSPRASSAAEMARFGTRGFAIAGCVGGGDRCDLRHEVAGGKRTLSLNGETQERAADYLAESGLVVWMGNEDLDLVRGSGSVRRRYLDFAASQLMPGYRLALRSYERALRSRNQLLKAPRPDEAQIAAYTKLLAEHGGELQRGRADLVAKLSPWASDAQRAVSGHRSEDLALRYKPSGAPDLAAAFAESLPSDLRRGQTQIGPHRDDAALDLNAMPAAQFASEGQQRTIALALKLAQARLLESERRQAPILLLDDIFGELDPGRRNALLGYLPDASQKLITTTHLGWLDGTGSVGSARQFSVHEGAVSSIG